MRDGYLPSLACSVSLSAPSFEGAEYPAGNGDGQSPVALLSEAYALRLVQAFSVIDSPALRRSVVELVEVMVNAKAGGASPNWLG